MEAPRAVWKRGYSLSSFDPLVQGVEINYEPGLLDGSSCVTTFV